MPGCLFSYSSSRFFLTCLFSNRLELGAGGGLVGLGVAIGCQVDHPIYITDQANMLPLMIQNISLNELGSHVVPLVLNW